jgi:hypothetical protein
MRRHVNRRGRGDSVRSELTVFGPGDLQAAHGEPDRWKTVAARFSVGARSGSALTAIWAYAMVPLTLRDV